MCLSTTTILTRRLRVPAMKPEPQVESNYIIKQKETDMNLIKSQIADAAYVELTYSYEVSALIRFAWINGRLFLPLFFLDNDQAEAICLVLADAQAEIYSRGSMDYFAPYEWLLKQRPDAAAALETMRNIAEPFRHKLSADPCRVCSYSHA